LNWKPAKNREDDTGLWIISKHSHNATHEQSLFEQGSATMYLYGQGTHKLLMLNAKLCNVEFTPYDVHQPLMLNAEFFNVELTWCNIHKYMLEVGT
jgi:hypothetical protein